MKERDILELRSRRLAGRETSARSLAPLRGGFLRWVPGRIPLSLHARGKAVEGIALDLPTAFSRTPATPPENTRVLRATRKHAVPEDAWWSQGETNRRPLECHSPNGDRSFEGSASRDDQAGERGAGIFGLDHRRGPTAIASSRCHRSG